MTDGQNTSLLRSCCWSITAYNKDIELVEDKDNWPKFVSKILGGRETCPTTGRLHFQGALFSHGTIRFSQVKKWLSQTRIEVARSQEALSKYVMKPETAAGEKKVVVSGYKFYRVDSFLKLIATEFIKYYMTLECEHSALGLISYIRDYTLQSGDEDDECAFLFITKRMVKEDLNVLNFIDSKIKKLWVTYYPQIILNLDKIASITDFVNDSPSDSANNSPSGSVVGSNEINLNDSDSESD